VGQLTIKLSFVCYVTMKIIKILPILGLFLSPAAFAGQILPTMYAREYCDLRELGVSKSEAMAAATQTAYVGSLPDAATVTIDGEVYATDVVRAARIVADRCPQYL